MVFKWMKSIDSVFGKKNQQLLVYLIIFPKKIIVDLKDWVLQVII